MHLPSPEERFTRVQEVLTGSDFVGDLERPVSNWVLASDRHLPQAFLGLPLRSVLALSYDQLASTHGVGARRLEKLIDVLERALVQSAAASEPPPPSHGSFEFNGTAPPRVLEGPFDPDEVTDPVWRDWCHVIRSHRLEHECLGRFAGNLYDLSQGLWLVQLSEYADKPLSVIRSLPGHGPARIGQLIEVFARVAESISGCPIDAPLSIRLLPPRIRDAVLWAEGLLRSGTVPDLRSIHEGFLSPIFAQLEYDLGPEITSMVRRRIGLDGPSETLECIAYEVGLTKERVRQLTAKAAQVFSVRWPEGKFILDNVYALIQTSPGENGHLELMHKVLDACFALEFTRGGSRSDVLAAWERAGRAKRTPMVGSEIRSWACEEFPDLPSDVVRRWLDEEGFRFDQLGGEPLYFSNDPLDKLLLHLYVHAEPVSLSELSDFVDGDDRNIRLRVERDPRFIEDEFKRVVLADHCSFFRRDNRWFVRLDGVQAATFERKAESISISELVHLVVGGLLQAEVCDATVWGVHRFTNYLLRKVYAATLAPAVTPFILASTFIRHSQGLVRPMRRRRLRWDSTDGSIPVRGKRGWVDHLATTAGVPMTVDELDEALRGRFQDYESYVLKQLNLDEDEEGVANYGCQYISGVPQVVPAVLIPRGWQLNLATMNVSEGVRLAVAKIVSMSPRWPIPREYLRRLPWMIQLCEHASFGQMRWAERSITIEEDPAEPHVPTDPEVSQPANDPDRLTDADKTNAAVDDLLSRFL